MGLREVGGEPIKFGELGVCSIPIGWSLHNRLNAWTFLCPMLIDDVAWKKD